MSLVSRAIRNILHNAREASSVGHDVVLTLSSNEEEVTISVLDEGEGLPDNTVINVFEPFETTRPNGTGLGLAIVQKVPSFIGDTFYQIENMAPAASPNWSLQRKVHNEQSINREKPVVCSCCR